MSLNSSSRRGALSVPTASQSTLLEGDTTKRRLDWVDALRGVAILAVLVVHSGVHFPAMNPFLYKTAWAGRYGVDLFFAISGFILYHTYRKLEGSSNMPRRIFIIRRWARLAPVYYLGILLYGVCLSSPKYGHLNSATEGFLNLAFLNAWVPAQANFVVPGGWSISAEASFGALFILIVQWVNTAQRAFWFCVFGWIITWQTTALVSSGLATFAGKDTFGTDLQYLPWAYLPTFISGIWCWHAWNNRSKAGGVVPIWVRSGCLLASVALFLVVPFEVWPNGNRTLLVGSASALLLYAWSGGPLAGWWVWPLGWLGRLSFGLYLIHFGLLDVAKVFAIGLLPLETPSAIHFAATLILTIAFSVPLAWVSWICLEQPVHAWVNKLSRQWFKGSRPRP